MFLGQRATAATPRRVMFQSRSAMTDDAVVISSVPEDEEENICQLPPVTPHLRACLAYMPKWTFDSRYFCEIGTRVVQTF